MGFSQADFLKRMNELPPEGVQYMYDQLRFAEFRFDEKNDL